MKKLLIIAGKSGVGKDTVMREVLAKTKGKSHKVITCTTRPKRENEIDGVDYYFKNELEFTSMIFEDKILEAQEFNEWFYGTPRESILDDVVNIIALSPEGIEGIYDVVTEKEMQIVVVYLVANDKIRIKRALDREKEPDIREIFRRYETDEEDFEDFQCHLQLINETKTELKNNVKLLTSLVKQMYEEEVIWKD